MNIVIASSKSWFTLNDEIAASHRVSYIDDNNDLTISNLSNLEPDMIFFPHWNWKVSPEIFERFPAIVFHTAPLPYGRGGSPIQNLILEGYEEAPVSAIQMTSDLDAGPIYGSQNISLKGSLDDIFDRINEAINALISDFLKNGLPDPKPQTGEPHYFKRRSVDDNEIPPTANLSQVFDYIRMLDSKLYPQSYIIYGSHKIEFTAPQFDGDEIIATCKIKKC